MSVDNRDDANLTAVLVDYAPDGTPEMVTRGWLDPQNRVRIDRGRTLRRGQLYDFSWDLQPDDHVFPAGHRIGLVVVSTDHDYTIRPLPGTQAHARPVTQLDPAAARRRHNRCEMKLPVMPPVAPMLAKPVGAIPPGQLYEPKWDGFRSIVFRDGDEVEIGSRNERPMTRYFPEVVEAVKRNFPPRAVIDGEIVIAGEGGLDFWALQQRIHPANSRVTMLADKTPASFVAFDLLALGDEDLTRTPFADRRATLEAALAEARAPIHVTPLTRDEEIAQRWFERFEGAGLDGLIAKRPDLTYQPDKRVMAKIKHVRTADCVVAGYRVHKTHKDAVGSLLLGLYVDEAAPPSQWMDRMPGAPRPRRRDRRVPDGPPPRAARRAPAARHRLRRPPVDWAAEMAQGTGGREPLEPEEGPLVRPTATRARGRGPLRLPRGSPLPPPTAVRPLAARPRPRLLRLRSARAAGAVRPRRRARGSALA